MEILNNALGIAIKTAFSEYLDLNSYQPKITACNQLKFGDYQSSDPMSLFHLLKSSKLQFKNPREVGLYLVKYFPPFDGQVDVANNGYLNFTLSIVFLQKEIEALLLTVCLPPLNHHRKQKIIIDFSSPNIAKEMHVGHLRSTIIGDSLARVFEFCGYNVDRINHVGDWGTQFGMLLAYLKDKYPDYLINKPPIADLQKFYKEAKVLFGDGIKVSLDDEAHKKRKNKKSINSGNPEFQKRAYNEVIKLQSGDADNITGWRLLCDTSMFAFQQIYDRLGIRLTTKGESYYNSKIPLMIEMLNQKNLLTIHNGMKCLFLESNLNQPLIIQKSDGGYTYDTTDMTAIYHRLVEEKTDWVLYVVDAGQSSHFDLIFKAAEMMEWHQPGKTKLSHVPFGVICGPDGKRFKTRSGETVKLVDLLDEAVIRAEKIVHEKNPELTKEEIKSIATAVGYSAVRYADLHLDRTTNYIFSYEKMLDFKGNTAVYLMYAYARICSILRKVNKTIHTETTQQIKLEHKTEIVLARVLHKYSNVIVSVLDTLQLNGLCSYLYEIATTVMAFHRDCRVIGDYMEVSRIKLLEATRKVMKSCFDLLGLIPLEKI